VTPITSMPGAFGLGRIALIPADRLIEALSDPVRRHRTMALVAVAYALVWTLYAVISKSSHDLHPSRSLDRSVED
jgi:hypothetical protein